MSHVALVIMTMIIDLGSEILLAHSYQFHVYLYPLWFMQFLFISIPEHLTLKYFLCNKVPTVAANQISLNIFCATRYQPSPATSSRLWAQSAWIKSSGWPRRCRNCRIRRDNLLLINLPSPSPPSPLPLQGSFTARIASSCRWCGVRTVRIRIHRMLRKHNPLRFIIRFV